MSFLTDLEGMPAKLEAFIAETKGRLDKLEAAVATDLPAALATIDEIKTGVSLIAPLVPQIQAWMPLVDEVETVVHHYADTNKIVLSPHPDVTPGTPAKA